MATKYNHSWINIGGVNSKAYVCGYCGKDVAPSHAYYTDPKKGHTAFIYICPFCQCPSFFSADGKQTPGVRFGRDVNGITDDGVRLLYEEARNCAAAKCYTSTVLLCRKILMHIAVANGAPEGLNFLEYVDFLKAKNYIPPKGEVWVDKIRTSGNLANHQIKIMSEDEAKMIIGFVEMLLRFVFEFQTLV